MKKIQGLVGVCGAMVGPLLLAAAASGPDDGEYIVSAEAAQLIPAADGAARNGVRDDAERPSNSDQPWVSPYVLGGGVMDPAQPNAGPAPPANCDGKINDYGDVCCHKNCTQCGGPGCSGGMSPNGATNCCVTHIRASQVYCLSTGGIGPCLIFRK